MVNVFEGSRRIALLIGGVWIVGCIAYAVFNEPHVRLTYSVSGLNTPPTLASRCDDDSALEFISRETQTGSSINIMMCFLAHRAASGEMLIPYAPAENGKVWMQEKYSSEVRAYTSAVSKSFQLTDEAIQEINLQRKAALHLQWKEAATFLGVGLSAGWFFVATLGWVVRGFMGIPRGKDERVSE